MSLTSSSSSDAHSRLSRRLSDSSESSAEVIAATVKKVASAIKEEIDTARDEEARPIHLETPRHEPVQLEPAEGTYDALRGASAESAKSDIASNTSSHQPLKVLSGSWKRSEGGSRPPSAAASVAGDADRPPSVSSAGVPQTSVKETPPPRQQTPQKRTTGSPVRRGSPSKFKSARERNIGHLFRDAEEYRARKQELVRRAQEEEVKHLFKPEINTRSRSQPSSTPVFTRLYQSQFEKQEKSAAKAHQQRDQEKISGTPRIIDKFGIDQHTRPEARFQWESKRRQKIEEMREQLQKEEVRAVREAPMLNSKSMEMVSSRSMQKQRIEDRLIQLGELKKTIREDAIRAEAQRLREESQPHISLHAASTPTAVPVHERLYSHRFESVQRRTESQRGSEVDEACTFSPTISRRSHVLMGGDLPRNERIEDRLLRQGQEHKQRREEQVELLQMLDEESRKVNNHVGPYSQLLVEMNEKQGKRHRSSYKDPIGVFNKKTLQELEMKHGQELTFTPYIGENSRAIDRQVHGEQSLSWEQRIGNLYHKEQEKEMRLSRQRQEKVENEILLCSRPKSKRRTSSTGSSGDMHARNRAWKQRLENKRRWSRHHNDEEEVKECTFRPTINTRSRSLTQRSSGYGSRGRTPSPPREGSVRPPSFVQQPTQGYPRSTSPYRSPAGQPYPPQPPQPHPLGHPSPSPARHSSPMPQASPLPASAYPTYSDFEAEREAARHQAVQHHLREQLSSPYHASQQRSDSVNWPDPYAAQAPSPHAPVSPSWNHYQQRGRSTERAARALSRSSSEWEEEELHDEAQEQLKQQLEYHRRAMEAEGQRGSRRP